MTPDQIEKIRQRLSFVESSHKDFDAETDWKIEPDRTSQRLMFVTAVRLAGALRGGVSIRLKTPIDAWEGDVYGHIEVQAPGLKGTMRLCAIEWRPLHDHDNPPNAPPAHRYAKLQDRWYPYDLNKELSIDVFLQRTAGIAAPLPRNVNNFQEYCDLCSNLWRCPDMMGVKPPPWSRTLL